MDIFFDTSVLVASALRHHPHHLQAAGALREAVSGRQRGFVAVHSLAEMYAVLTRLPVQPAIHPTEARQIIEENIVAHLHVLSITAADYREVIKQMAQAGMKGGIIYDALLLKCARKRHCDRIYTFNVGHFERLAPDLARVFRAPS